MSEGTAISAASVRAEFEKWDGHPSPRRHFATAFVDVDALCQHVVELRAQLRNRLPLATPEAGLEMARAAFAEAARWSDQAPLVEERANMYRADGTWSEEEYFEWKRDHDTWSRDVAAQFGDFVKRFQLDAAHAARPERRAWT